MKGIEMDTYGRITTPDLDKNRMQELIAQNEHLQFERNKNEKTIADLGSVLDSERRLISSLQSQIDTLIEHLMHYVQIGDMEEDVAQDLADIFGRSLIRTVTVRVTADIDIEVNVPLGYDLDDLDGDLEVEVTSAYSADVEIVNSESSSIQVEEM